MQVKTIGYETHICQRWDNSDFLILSVKYRPFISQ